MLWHLTFACGRRHPLFADEERRRAAIRRLADLMGAELVLFSLVDDHLHVVLRCSRTVAGVRARALIGAWRALGATSIEHRDTRPVENRAHMLRLVSYFVKQVQHHGLVGAQAALWTGSCFLDLVGARAIGALDLPGRLVSILPRYDLREAYACVGMDTMELRPLGRDRVRELGAARIAVASAAAHCVGPQLRGRLPAVVSARRTAVGIGAWAGFPAGEMAWALGITPRGVRKLLAQGAPENVVRATHLRLALEERLAPLARSGQGANEANVGARWGMKSAG